MSLTRAAVLYSTGSPLEIRTLEIIAPGPGEVMVKLAASGICGSDYLGSLSKSLRVPMVLGHEGAGVVEQVGAGVSHCKVGDHVVLSLIPQCGICFWCVNGQPHLCAPGTLAQRAGALSDGRPRLRQDGQDVFQYMGLGTFSERIVVAETAVVPIPQDVPLTQAALIGCSVLTGLGAALRVARVPRGGSVLVLGCGGVGMNIIQGARIAGADRIIAVDTMRDKQAIAKRLGATAFATPDALSEVVEQVTHGKGVDVAFDVVGSPMTARASLDATRRGGQACIVGAKPGAEIVIEIMEDLIRGAKSLCGCHYGSSHVLRDVPQVISALNSGALDLNTIITHRMKLDDINYALELMTKGEGLRTIIEY